MPTLNPYVGFNGKCAEAMEFYKSILGGELTIQKVGDSPIAGQCPEAMQGQVMHSSLQGEGILLMGTDMSHPDQTYDAGNAIAISIGCDSNEQINAFFSGFAAGGTIVDPLKKQFWGGVFGVVKDKFGIVWMFNYQEN